MREKFLFTACVAVLVLLLLFSAAKTRLMVGFSGTALGLLFLCALTVFMLFLRSRILFGSEEDE